MKKTQLLIMAAGIGSRFGEGIKQLTKLGPNGEIIMDYSIADAKSAGFDEVIFVIRKDIEKDFREIIGNRIEKHISCKYVFQELDMLPSGFSAPKDRVKPYGTGHCILCAKDVIDSDFMVINADDYYGKEGFKKIHDFLVSNEESADLKMCMAGFHIENTLSENGTVTRGVAKEDGNHNLITVNETYEVYKDADGKIYGEDENKNKIVVDNNSLVSMNMWGLPKNFCNHLEEQFINFLKLHNDNIKSEFLLPTIIDEIIKNKIGTVKVLPVDDKWFGVTYASDKEIVRSALQKIGGATL